MRHTAATRPRLVSHADRARLRRFLDACEESLERERADLANLRARVERFVAVRAEELPDDVATLHAQVRMRDLTSGRTLACTVVLPRDADVAIERRSPLSWPGSVLLGAREGDELLWPLRSGTRQMRLERVLFQPEAVQRVIRTQARRRRTKGGQGRRVGRAEARRPAVRTQLEAANHDAPEAAR